MKTTSASWMHFMCFTTRVDVKSPSQMERGYIKSPGNKLSP